MHLPASNKSIPKASIFVLTLFTALNWAIYGQGQSDTLQLSKPKIAMLGMFHFGATGDLAAIVMENPEGDKRQKEIKEVVMQLKAYKPTKVLVEYPIAKNDTLHERYALFLKDRFDLPINETYQIGFRLAKEMGHSKIYGIDSKLNLPFDLLTKYCQENNKMAEFQKIVELAKTLTAEKTEELKQQHLSKFLKAMNSKKFDQLANGLYLNEVLNIGDPSNEVGAEVSAVWYKRNMIMLKNITSWIAQREERILVIVGSSHRALIRDLLQNRTDLEYVEIADYLGPISEVKN